jgi:hypothetical protein
MNVVQALFIQFIIRQKRVLKIYLNLNVMYAIYFSNLVETTLKKPASQKCNYTYHITSNMA